jgi:hypothetical protein
VTRQAGGALGQGLRAGTMRASAQAGAAAPDTLDALSSAQGQVQAQPTKVKKANKKRCAEGLTTQYSVRTASVCCAI